MKKIITTVGTSIFTNYQKREIRNSFDSYKDIDNQLEDIEKNSTSAKDRNKNDDMFQQSWITNSSKDGICDVIKKYWLKGIHKSNGIWSDWNKKDLTPNLDASAEIKSILKIVEELKEDVEVYLLATDTVLSVLACELIEQFFTPNGNAYVHDDCKITVTFKPQFDIICDLQVNNSKLFKAGLTNLIQRLYGISSLDSTADTDYYTNKGYILNVTGGFKGIIPFMTIFGQVHRVAVKYIFEDTNELLTIPPIPISIQNSLFDDFGEQFISLEEEGIGSLSNYSYDFQTKAESCLEIDGSDICLSSLGLVLWKKYKASYFIFYASDGVWNDIQKQDDIKRILETKFWNENTRNSKTGPKLEHKTVYDDGNNSNRIFYFIDNNSVYIYKTFSENYDEYDKYWRNTKFSESDKERIIKESNLRKIKKV
jgi:hypothetical protein